MRKLLFESLIGRPLTEPAPAADVAAMTELAIAVGDVARRRLGRSLSIREVDAGSCNGCELEIHALNNAYYDVERFGIRFVASPRHADVLLVISPEFPAGLHIRGCPPTPTQRCSMGNRRCMRHDNRPDHHDRSKSDPRKGPILPLCCQSMI